MLDQFDIKLLKPGGDSVGDHRLAEYVEREGHALAPHPQYGSDRLLRRAPADELRCRADAGGPRSPGRQRGMKRVATAERQRRLQGQRQGLPMLAVAIEVFLEVPRDRYRVAKRRQDFDEPKKP